MTFTLKCETLASIFSDTRIAVVRKFNSPKKKANDFSENRRSRLFFYSLFPKRTDSSREFLQILNRRGKFIFRSNAARALRATNDSFHGHTTARRIFKEFSFLCPNGWKLLNDGIFFLFKGDHNIFHYTHFFCIDIRIDWSSHFFKLFGRLEKLFSGITKTRTRTIQRRYSKAFNSKNDRVSRHAVQKDHNL